MKILWLLSYLTPSYRGLSKWQALVYLKTNCVNMREIDLTAFPNWSGTA